MRYFLRTIFLLYLIILGFSQVNGQYGIQTQKVDSLKSLLLDKEGTEAVDIINEIAYYVTLSNSEEAEEWANEAIKKSRVIDYDKGRADAHQRLGILFYRRGYSSSSIRQLINAESLYKELGDSSALSVNYRCLGNAYAGYEDYATILRYYNLALDYVDTTTNRIVYATSLHSIGSVLYKKNNLVESEIQFKKAYHIYKEEDYSFGIAGYKSSMGNLLMQKGLYQQALDVYQESLVFYESIQDKATLAGVLHRIAKAHYHLGNPKTAEEEAHHSLKYGQEIKALNYIRDCYQLLYEINYDRKDYDSALSFHIKYTTIQEDLFDEKKEKLFILLEDERGMAKAQKENLELQSAADKQRLASILILIALLGSVIFILALFYVNQQKKKAILNKNALLDMLSHDLLNPAGSIRGLAEILAEENPENKKIKSIQASSEGLIQIIQETSTIARIREGAPIHMEPLLVSELISLCQIQLQSNLRESQIQLLVDLPDGLTIFANPIVATIFRNYIHNAIKYAPRSQEIIISGEASERLVTICVADQGQTISADKRKVIFNRKYQIQPTLAQGSGLGLAIANTIAKAHNGTVWVEPNVPKGNRFYLRVPAANVNE